MKKRLLSLLLTLAMVLTLAPVAFAAGDDNTAQDADSTEAVDTAQTAVVTSNDDLKAAITDAKDGDTITLGEGTFTTYGNASPKKSLTFVGSGDKTVWTIGDLTKDVKAEANGDYSFDGCGTITFKNMTLQSDKTDYRGFIRINNTVVENCTINGKTAYWGYQTANFTNCTFNAQGNDYVLWDYSTPEMTFDSCTFNVFGKTINAYVEQTSDTARKIEMTNCTVNSTEKEEKQENKAVLNIKNSTQAWGVSISGTTVTGLTENTTTGSNLYQVEKAGDEGKAVSVSVNGELVWKDGAAVSTAKVAEVGGQQYTSLQAAIDAAADNATVKLLANVDLAQTVVVSDKTITLDMAGKTITNTIDLWDNPDENAGNWSLLSVRGTGNLTITGNGTFQTKENDCYAVDVQDETAKLTIENGTFVGNIHAVYVQTGEANIKGGTYSIQQTYYPDASKAYEFVLNLYDENRQNGTAKLTVSGGTFEKFNPADCQAEGKGTNFCAEGYTATGDGDTYTVVTGENAAVANAGANYNTLADALSASADGQTVTLLKDTTVSGVDNAASRTIISKAITLDLQGKTIHGPDNMGDYNTNFCILVVDKDTTIVDSVGGGGIDSGKNGGYCINIRNGATLTINAGKYYGGGTAVQVQKGTLVINDGSFACEPYDNPTYGYKFLINCIDAAWKDGTAKVSIKGGTFANFDPSDSASENPRGSFCASGYVAVKGGTEDAPVWTVEDHRVAEINGVGYTSLQDAFDAAEDGDTVKMLTDVDLAQTVVVSDKTITLDMNGKKLYNTKDLWDKQPSDWALVSVRGSGDLTITGEGTLKALENDCYAVDVQDGATLTVENGTFVGNIHAVYVQKGAAYIKGGTYSIQQTYYPDPSKAYEFVLNLYDANRENNTAKMVVTGGTFVKFNPANNKAEGENTNFCAPGYKTELTNGVYVVKAGTNDAMAKVDAAIKEGAAPDTIKAAVDAVVEIPNETLADNSTIMDKLAQLDTIVQNGSVIVNIKHETGLDTIVSEAKNAALSASTTATDGQTITIHVKNNSTADTAAAVKAANGTGDAKALDIAMTHQIGNGKAEPIQPKAPVVLTFTLPTGWENAEIVRVDEEKNTTEIVPSTVSNGMISGVFNHFSTYVLVQTDAEENPNQYEVIFTPNKTDVSAGDEIKYTVTLKHTAGDNANLGYILITPVIKNTELLSLESGEGNTTNGITFSNRNGAPEFSAQNSGTGKELGLNESMEIGTLTYKVKAYPTDNTPVEVTISDTDQVSSSAYRESATPTVTTEKDVTYHMITVTFKQDNDATKDKVYYAKYEKAGLYKSLDAMKKGEATVDVGTPDDSSTEYRLADNYWHLETKPEDVYTADTTFKTSATYVTKRVELVKITIPETPKVTVEGVIERGDPKGTYVDKNTELNFKIDKEPNAGEKYEVTVTVNGKTVTPKRNDDGSYTVKREDVTGEVKITVKSVLDLSADDIRIFTTNEDSDAKAYLQYSAYSGNDTLVLIQGKAGANYTLNAGEPVIYATDAYKDIDEGKTYTHAVLVPSQETVSKKAMLDYLTSVGLKVTNQKNETITTSWDTNGNGNVKRDLGDVQAANDFKTLTDLKWTPSDDLLLLADVMTIPENNKETADKYAEGSYTAKRDGQVNDADVNAFVYFYAKLG